MKVKIVETKEQEKRLLNSKALVYIEAEFLKKTDDLKDLAFELPLGWVILRQKRAGQEVYLLIQSP